MEYHFKRAVFIFSASDYTLGFSNALGRADRVEKHACKVVELHQKNGQMSDLQHFDVSFMLYVFVREMAREVQSMQ